MSLHIIKLVVGSRDLAHFVEQSQHEIVDFEGQPALPCWTRYAPKRAEDILKNDGSIYRVINNRIVCRLRILGFESVEIEGRGKMCMIMQDPEVIETVSQPHRPFQGWRYFQDEKAPKDKGVFNPDATPCDPAMEAELRDAGLI